jgi:hypothetical protein
MKTFRGKKSKPDAIGARTINDLTSFEVEMGGADDFARV